MSEFPAEIRATFSDAELAEIDASKIVRADGSERNVAQLALAWQAHVEKIDKDRALPWTDHSVWTEHDLVAALFMRDFVEDALSQLRPELADKARQYVANADDQFRSFTAEDSGERVGRIAGVDMTGRGWWWFRVPTSGPIVEDLARY
jgi:hypothetical protein